MIKTITAAMKMMIAIRGKKYKQIAITAHINKALTAYTIKGIIIDTF